MTSRPARRFLERRVTADAKIPLSADDLGMEHSWRCIPIRPTADGDWFIVDSSRNRWTVWGRWVLADRLNGRRP
jgi:hypothetical protein